MEKKWTILQDILLMDYTKLYFWPGVLGNMFGKFNQAFSFILFQIAIDIMQVFFHGLKDKFSSI